MKPIDDSYKSEIKLRLAAAVKFLIKKKKYKSLRDFAASAGFEYAHVQRITSGKVDISLSTFFALANGFEISPASFAKIIENLGELET